MVRIDSGGASTGSYIALTNQGDAHKLIGGWPNLAKKMAICENILTMHTHAAQERKKANSHLLVIRACYGCSTYLTHFSTVVKQCNHLHFALSFCSYVRRHVCVLSPLDFFFSFFKIMNFINSACMGLFGWVAKSQPGSTKPPSDCLVACFDVQTRLYEATNHPLAWLQKNVGAGCFLGARLG